MPANKLPSNVVVFLILIAIIGLGVFAPSLLNVLAGTSAENTTNIRTQNVVRN